MCTFEKNGYKIETMTIVLRKELFPTELRDSLYEDFEYEAKISMNAIDREFLDHREYQADMIRWALRDFERHAHERRRRLTDDDVMKFERSWWVKRIRAISLGEQTKAVIENRGVISQEAAKVFTPHAIDQHSSVFEKLPSAYTSQDLPQALSLREAEEAYDRVVGDDGFVPDNIVTRIFGSSYPRLIIEPISEEALEIVSKIGPGKYEQICEQYPHLSPTARHALTIGGPSKRARINFETGQPEYDDNGDLIFDIDPEWFENDYPNFLDDGETINPFAKFDNVTFSLSGRMYEPEDVIMSRCSYDEGIFIPYDVMVSCIDLESMINLLLSYGAFENISALKEAFNLPPRFINHVMETRRLMLWDHDEVDDEEAITARIKAIGGMWHMKRKWSQKTRKVSQRKKHREEYTVKDFVHDYFTNGRFIPKHDDQEFRLYVPVLEFLYQKELDVRGYDNDDPARLSRKSFVPLVRNELEKWGLFESDVRMKPALRDVRNFSYPHDVTAQDVWQGIVKSRGNAQIFFTTDEEN